MNFLSVVLIITGLINLVLWVIIPLVKWLNARYIAKHVEGFSCITDNYSRADYAVAKITREEYQDLRDDYSSRELIAALKKHGTDCYYCGCETYQKSTASWFKRFMIWVNPFSKIRIREIDHVISVFLGGRYHRTNLVPSCKPCNRKKSCWIMGRFLKPVLAHLQKYQPGLKVHSGCIGRKYKKEFKLRVPYGGITFTGTRAELWG
jgi:hypothetical protein